ncbi:MAG: hypothetical protein KGK07_15175 [Chloroflexota bacterium]|nr:hypothetical protein [Chloroflexota bacterium]
MTRKRRWMQGSVRRPGKLHEDMGMPEGEALSTSDILSHMTDVALAMGRAASSHRAGLRRQLARANEALNFRRYRGWRPKVGQPYRDSVTMEM